MPPPLAMHLARFAERLGDLRVRLKEAARSEVAQAIAETLAETTCFLLGCPPPDPRSQRGPASPWEDDSWEYEPYEDRSAWADGSGSSDEPVLTVEAEPSRIVSAITAAIGAARWSFSRSGHPVPALAIAAVIACVVLVAGDKVASLLSLCSDTQHLLHFADRPV
jgi:hypothetical protein